MKLKLVLPLIGFMALIGVANVEGQQGAAPQAASSASETTIIEVKGSKRDALKILKSQGVNAIELKGASYTLPTVEVLAPTQVDFGEMIVVSAAIDKTKFPEGLQKVNYQWTVIEDGRVKNNAVVWPDGTKIFFAAGMKPKTIQVLLDVDCLFGTPSTVNGTNVLVNAEMDSPNISVTTIMVGDGVPIPPVPPTPVPPVPVPPTPVPPTPPAPTPDPTFPEGKYGLSKTVYDAFKTVSGATPQEKTALAEALAANYDAIAGKVAGVAGYNDVAVILQDVKDGNVAAFVKSGVAKEKFVSVKAVLGDQIFTLISNGGIATSQDVGIACREIALGLRSVK